ncbi:hypothetical protein ACRAWF_04555 [Streptomyces sp. L7]
MGELRARCVEPDQARRFGRGERVGGDPRYRRRQVRAVRSRGEQQARIARPGAGCRTGRP